MTNVVMIARGRAALTRQALKSLYENTPRDEFSLVMIDDASYRPVTPDNFPELRKGNVSVVLELTKHCGILGMLRNMGQELASTHPQLGRGDYLLFVDNDVYFRPQWLERMTDALDLDRNCGVLGGQRHPYHGVNFRPQLRVDATDAVAGYAMMMRWGVWDAIGPFDAHAKGLGQSEDFALCRKAYTQGMYVGYHNPPTILHTGMTDTNGKPIAGADQFERFEGVLYA